MILSKFGQFSWTRFRFKKTRMLFFCLTCVIKWGQYIIILSNIFNTFEYVLIKKYTKFLLTPECNNKIWRHRRNYHLPDLKSGYKSNPLVFHSIFESGDRNKSFHFWSGIHEYMTTQEVSVVSGSVKFMYSHKNLV